MNKNVILFLTCIGLGTFTYYYQELGDREQKREREREEEILNFKALGEVKSFELPHVSIQYADGHYELKETQETVDSQRVDKFLGQLSYIKVKRVLSDKEREERSQYIPNDDLKMTFHFENGKASFVLGEKLSFSRDFYLEITKEINGQQEKQLVIAFNSEVVDEVYAKEVAHKSDHLYRRFKSLYYLSEDFFRDHRVFGPWMDSKWSLQRIYIDNNRNKGHSLLLDKKQTNPEIPSFINLNETAVREYEKELAYLSAKRVISFHNPKILNNEKRLAMVIVSSTKGSTRFNLYKDLNQEFKGYFLAFPDRSYLYELTQEQAELFLGSVQRFWSLKLWQGKRPDGLKLNMNFPDGKYQVNLPPVTEQVFKVTSDRGRAIHLEFQKLINFLSGPADYWVAGEGIAENYLKQFSLDWGEGEFFLMIRSGEVLLYHRESMQGLIFKIQGRIPFGVVEGDYFI
ncbi:MAG: hypothetical protein CME60_03415 [Halobacteriovoraceae bacterium]|nr:hypothetical protein [Halobacteriovoraceae bacterium]